MTSDYYGPGYTPEPAPAPIPDRAQVQIAALTLALAQCKAVVEDGTRPPSARLELVRDIVTPILEGYAPMMPPDPVTRRIAFIAEMAEALKEAMDLLPKYGQLCQSELSQASGWSARQWRDSANKAEAVYQQVRSLLSKLEAQP